MTDQSIALPRPITLPRPTGLRAGLGLRLRRRVFSMVRLPTVDPKDHWIA